jgi:hypothetical protein
LKRALTPENSSIQKDSKINPSTSKWFLEAFAINIDDNDSFNKSPIFKVADYKNKPSTTFFRMLIKIITFGLSERLFNKNATNQYIDKTTAFLAIKDKIDEAFKTAENSNKEVEFNIELDGITKKIKLTEDDGSVKIDVYHDGNGKLCASTTILKCTLDEIKDSIKNESIELDKVKDKFNERIECNKLSRKNKQSYLKLSEGSKKYYGELNEKQKKSYLKLSDEEKGLINKFPEKYMDTYIMLIPNYRDIFIKSDLDFKNKVTEIYDNYSKEYYNAQGSEERGVVVNHYNKIINNFFEDKQSL